MDINSFIAGRIYQRIIDAKYEGKNYITHGIDNQNASAPEVISILYDFCDIKKIDCESQPYGGKYTFWF